MAREKEPAQRTQAGAFDASFRESLAELVAWRRDVRRFRRDPLPEGLVESLLAIAHQAPSVGNSQPWRFVLVERDENRTGVRNSFLAANAEALEDFTGDKASTYARLKLAGLDAAPVQLAVFCDEATGQGHGLGRRTMPEMLAYSCVCAINTLWLAARAEGVGVGLGVDHRSPGGDQPARRAAGLAARRLSLPRLAGRGTPGSGTGARQVAVARKSCREASAPLNRRGCGRSRAWRPGSASGLARTSRKDRANPLEEARTGRRRWA